MYRQLILEAAERVFAEVGYETAKVQDVANAAGVSLGTLYSVFPGKADIHGAIHEWRAGEIIEVCAATLRPGDTPADAMLRGIGAYVRYAAEHPDYLKMTLREGHGWTTPDSLQQAERIDAWHRGFAMAREVIAHGVEQGVFRDEPPSFHVRAMIALSQVCLADWVDRDMADDADTLVQRVLYAVNGVIAVQTPLESR
jgi:AcrR family transcriptional regulator